MTQVRLTRWQFFAIATAALIMSVLLMLTAARPAYATEEAHFCWGTTIEVYTGRCKDSTEREDITGVYGQGQQGGVCVGTYYGGINCSHAPEEGVYTPISNETGHAEIISFANGKNTVYGIVWGWKVDPNPYSWHSNNLGGYATSDPDILSAGGGNLEVFERGSDAALWTRSFAQHAWNGWSSVASSIQGGPGAVWGGGMANVTARLSDNTINSWWWNGSWGSYNLGGNNTSDPDMSAWGTTRMDMFARGSDNALWHRAWKSGTWGGWESLGGTLTGGPAAVSWGENRIDVVARASDNTLQTWYYDGSWHTGPNLGGVNTSDPDIAATAPGHLVVAVRGSDNALWLRQYDVSTGWGGWETLGGTLSSGPGAVGWGGTHYRLDIVAQATDHSLTHWWWGPGGG